MKNFVNELVMYMCVATKSSKRYTNFIIPYLRRGFVYCSLILAYSCTEINSQKITGSRIDRISALAEKGSPAAQTALGQLYEQGVDFALDPEKAMYWYRRSATKGDALAEFHIGSLYERGAGVARDYVEAAKWYKRASDRGNESAQAALAFLYDRGLGVERDFLEARALYKLASRSWARVETFPLEYTYTTGRNGVTSASPTSAVADYKLQATKIVSGSKKRPAIEINMAALDKNVGAAILNTNTGNYFLDLSIYKNEAAALLAWNEINSIDSDLFQKLLVKIQPIASEREKFSQKVKLIVGPIESGIQTLKL